MRKLVVRRRVIAPSAIAVALVAIVVAGYERAQIGNEALALNGVELTVPAGWDGEAFINPSGMSVFRLGSFPFQHRADDDVGQVAQASMAPNDVLINIVDFTATDPGEENSYYRPLTRPLTVDGSQALQQEGYTSPAAIIRGVAFGMAPPSRAQVEATNAVLRTLAAS
jgi:hypothetical protein